ncbi:MAG: HlyD family efflux transporter periplasmic adaptor subunit [Firmicutes bacterium]|nr:HlyD family efflux transporter periplasmic adaptor subunit [Bacillota bacterium]
MQIKISKKTKRIILIYIMLVVLLYLVIYVLPKATDMFETTQTLENGVLEISCETEGYIVKDEAVVLAYKTGTLTYVNVEGTVVKKGGRICSIEEESEQGDKKEEQDGKYTEYLKALSRFSGLYYDENSPISGIFSKNIDGGEKFFSPDNLENISKEKAESIHLKTLQLEREHVVKGDPIYKITGDDHWYIVCWIDKETAEEYKEGDYVTLTLPEGNVKAEIQKKSDEKSDDKGLCRFVFYINTYYEDLENARKVDMTVTMSNSSGLIVDNECLIKKDGQLGVYVKTKDEAYIFKPVNIKASNSKQSAISDGTYVNEKYEQVITVNVYDEVLRNPENALERELKDKDKDDN